MALQGKAVQRFTAESVFPRDHFGTIELTKIIDAEALLYSFAERGNADTRLLMQRDV